jgi:hypothetical protein
MTTFNKDDIEGLKSMGFSPKDIQKLLSIPAEVFQGLLESKEPKPSTPKPRKSKIKSGELYVTYIKKCSICGFEHSVMTAAVDKKEWSGLHPWYKRGDSVVKIERCHKCREYLLSLTKENLIEIILRDPNTKTRYNPPPVEFPHINWEEEEHVKYPVAQLQDVQAMSRRMDDEKKNQ